MSRFVFVPFLFLAACSTPVAPPEAPAAPAPVEGPRFELPATEPVGVPSPEGSVAQRLETAGLDRAALKGLVLRSASGRSAALSAAADLDDAWLALGRCAAEPAPVGEPKGAAELLFQGAAGPRRVLLAVDAAGGTLDLDGERGRYAAGPFAAWMGNRLAR